MIDLQNTSFLFLDCQTTGTQPTRDHLLEIAWGQAAATADLSKIENRIFQHASVSPFILSMTGLEHEAVQQGQSEETIFQELTKNFQDGKNQYAIVHYAQFEKRFLEVFFQKHGLSELPFKILCTSKIARRLYPQLPSRNLRALVGYFGGNSPELKRAASHVQGTFEIWKSLSPELDKMGFENWEQLLAWVDEKPTTKKKAYEYRIDKATRLALPKKPGLYRMRDKNGKILYIGKATSLKDRVNSYFRGQKGRDSFKLEMLTRTWSLDFVECESPLEAALLETDEIKKHDPPYNISLKEDGRKLLFMDSCFLQHSSLQTNKTPLGPFKTFGPLAHLKSFRNWLDQKGPASFFYLPISEPTLRSAWQIFLERNHLNSQIETRSLVAWGLNKWRHFEEPEPEEIVEVEANSEEEKEPTPEEVAQKFERFFMRMGHELWKSRKMTRLLNVRLVWLAELQRPDLFIEDGQLVKTRTDHSPPEYPWKNRGIADYDRLSILHSYLQSHDDLQISS